MEFDDDYSSSELENYSIYSDDSDYQDDFSPHDGEMDSLLNICEIHFPNYTPEQISAYVCSLHQNTLQTIIQGIYEYSQIRNTISHLRSELENFHSPKNTNLIPDKTTPTKFSKTDYLRVAFKFWKNSKSISKTSQLSATAKEFYPELPILTGKVESNLRIKIPSTPTSPLPEAYNKNNTIPPNTEPHQIYLKQDIHSFVTTESSTSPKLQKTTKLGGLIPNTSILFTHYSQQTKINNRSKSNNQQRSNTAQNQAFQTQPTEEFQTLQSQLAHLPTTSRQIFPTLSSLKSDRQSSTIEFPRTTKPYNPSLKFKQPPTLKLQYPLTTITAQPSTFPTILHSNTDIEQEIVQTTIG